MNLSSFSLGSSSVKKLAKSLSPRSIYRRLFKSGEEIRIPNIWGDRDVEYSFLVGYLPSSGGKALDFGSFGSYVPLMLAQRGYEVVAMDRQTMEFFWVHPRVRLLQADILENDLDWNEHFDLITNISSIEHVGLAGRYGVKKDCPEGDLLAMRKLRDWLKKGGIHILTVPVGRDAVFSPLARVYGEKRLPMLLEGYTLLHEEYWAKPGRDNKWYPVEKKYALSYQAEVEKWSPGGNIYALGCFLLQK